MYCTTFVSASYSLVLRVFFATQAHWSPHRNWQLPASKNRGWKRIVTFEMGISQRNLLPWNFRGCTVYFTFTYPHHLLYTSGFLLEYTFRRSFLSSILRHHLKWSFFELHEFPRVSVPPMPVRISQQSIHWPFVAPLWRPLPCVDAWKVRCKFLGKGASQWNSKLPNCFVLTTSFSDTSNSVELTDQ